MSSGQRTPPSGREPIFEPVKVRWWHNRGLHAHVTYPDGCWERMTRKGDPYWEIDSLVIDLEREWGKGNVQVTP